MVGVAPDGGDRLLNGRYRLIEVVGRGGMGTVWRGHDEMLDREVAIKQLSLSPDLNEDERAELAALAIGEARLTARLNHPGIITIYDVIDDDGVPIIVMEFLAGRSLADILKEQVRLPYRRVAEIGAQMLEALREAHAAGLVHRDLKPANVLITDRRVVLTDFGVSQRVGERDGAPGDVSGTPAFMAPEQAENAAASPAVDLWALGATLFNAVEGHPPYEGPDYATVLLTLLTQDPPVPANAGPLTPMISALLRKDPQRRPTAEQVADQLAEILSATDSGAAHASGTAGTARTAGKPPTAVRPTKPAPPSRPAPRTTGTNWRVQYQYSSPPAPRKRRGGVAAITAIVAGLMIYTFSHIASSGSAPSGITATPDDPFSGMPALPSVPADTSVPLFAKDFMVTAFSPDGRHVAFAGDSGAVLLYDTVTHRSQGSFVPRLAGVNIGAMTFSPDGRTIAVGLDSGAVDLWDIGEHTARELTGFTDAVRALRFGRDGQTLTVAGPKGEIGSWTIRTAKYVAAAMLPTGSGSCVSLALNADGRGAACGYTTGDDKSDAIIVRHGAADEALAPWPGVEPDDGVAFSPDGKKLVYAEKGDQRLQVWDVAGHRSLGELDVSGALAGAPVFSPDGTTLAVPVSGTDVGGDPIELWNVQEKKQVATLPGAHVGQCAVAFGPDGSRLVAANGDGGELWDVRSPKRLASWTG